MQRLHYVEITGWLKIEQLRIIVFILILANSCILVFYSFIIYFYLCAFFASYPRVECFHDHLLTPSLHWAWFKHRRVWMGSSRQKWLIWSSFSDLFKWIFRITVTRNGQLNLHKLWARAVVDLGKWYPYLVASTMWDPQRKKDFLMRRLSPCLHDTKFCLFCKKKITTPQQETISSANDLFHLQNFSTVTKLQRPRIIFFVRWQNTMFRDSSFAGSSYFANITN